MANLASGNPAAESQRHDPSAVTKSVIRGTFREALLTPLVYLIKSLCPEIGHVGEFGDWDRVYNAGPDVKAPKNSIRLRQHLIEPGQSQHASKENRSYSLMYLGIPDRRVAAPCEKRPVTTVSMGKEADAVLTLIGCVFVYEYVRKGLRYRTRDGLVIEVYIVYKLKKPGDPSSADSLTEGDERYGIVEIISEDGATPEQLTAFMQHLSPFVSLKTQPKKKS